MARIPLLFIRSQLEGIWEILHYSIVTRSHESQAVGPVYLAQMIRLPETIMFEKANWVMKGSGRRFNQIDSDQSQEWSRWTLLYIVCAHMCAFVK